MLTVTAGSPFSQVIRISDAKNIWTDLSDLEIRAQLRMGKTTDTGFIANLHDYMTSVFDNNDLVVSWIMTGQDTRTLYALNWGVSKKGFFNLIVSDIGPTDSRALVVPTLCLVAVDTTTTGEDIS